MYEAEQDDSGTLARCFGRSLVVRRLEENVAIEAEFVGPTVRR
jgi:hypothetical protein